MSETEERVYRRKRQRIPPLQDLMRWVSSGVSEATDGCRVAAGEFCKHGCPSWLVYLGYVEAVDVDANG